MRYPLILLPFLAACVPAVDRAPCTPQGCLIAAETARILSADIGMDFGDGVTLRDVQAAGGELVVDLDLPILGSDLPPGGGLIFAREIGNNFARGFCAQDGVQTFFDIGNRMRVRTFGPDGAMLSQTVQTSC